MIGRTRYFKVLFALQAGYKHQENRHFQIMVQQSKPLYKQGFGFHMVVVGDSEVDFANPEVYAVTKDADETEAEAKSKDQDAMRMLFEFGERAEGTERGRKRKAEAAANLPAATAAAAAAAAHIPAVTAAAAARARNLNPAWSEEQLQVLEDAHAQAAAKQDATEDLAQGKARPLPASPACTGNVHRDSGIYGTRTTGRSGGAQWERGREKKKEGRRKKREERRKKKEERRKKKEERRKKKAERRQNQKEIRTNKKRRKKTEERKRRMKNTKK
jgi:hypothetical protein